MPGRIVAQLQGELAQSKEKGKSFVKALWEKLKPKSIAKESPKTQKK